MDPVINTIQYVQNNQRKSAVFGHSMLNMFNRGRLNKHVFDLAYQFHMLGLDGQLETIRSKYENYITTQLSGFRSRVDVALSLDDLIKLANEFGIELPYLAAVKAVNGVDRQVVLKRAVVAYKEILKGALSQDPQTAVCRSYCQEFISSFAVSGDVALQKFAVAQLGMDDSEISDNAMGNVSILTQRAKQNFANVEDDYLVAYHQRRDKLLSLAATSGEGIEECQRQLGMRVLGDNDFAKSQALQIEIGRRYPETPDKHKHKLFEKMNRENLEYFTEEAWKVVRANQAYIDENKGKQLKQYLNRLARQQGLNSRIEVSKEIFTTDENGDKHRHKVYELRQQTGYTPEDIGKKNSVRKRKSVLKKVSLGIAVVVGVGEGLVAAAFFGGPLIIALLAIGIPAFAVNYFLFKGSAFNTLKQVFLKRVYVNERGETISTLKKRLIDSTIVCSLAAGICYGVLSLGSALGALGPLVFGITAAASVAAPPVGLLVVAGLVATVTAVAVATLFYVAFADFIKNDRLSQAKNYYKRFWKDITARKGSAKDYTLGENCKYVCTVAAKCAWEFAKVAVALAATVLVTVATCGVFYQKTISILTQLPKWSAAVSAKIATVTSALAGVVNAFFMRDSVSTARDYVLKGLSTGLKWLGRKLHIIKSPVPTHDESSNVVNDKQTIELQPRNGARKQRLIADVQRTAEQDTGNHLQRAAMGTAIAKTAFFIGCAGVNGFAQGEAGASAAAQGFLRPMVQAIGVPATPAADQVLGVAGQVAWNMGSDGANFAAVDRACYQPGVGSRVYKIRRALLAGLARTAEASLGAAETQALATPPTPESTGIDSPTLADPLLPHAARMQSESDVEVKQVKALFLSDQVSKDDVIYNANGNSQTVTQSVQYEHQAGAAGAHQAVFGCHKRSQAENRSRFFASRANTNTGVIDPEQGEFAAAIVEQHAVAA